MILSKTRDNHMLWTIHIFFFVLLVLTFNLCVRCKPQISDTYFCVYAYTHIKIFRGTDIMLFWCHHMKISLFSLLDITALFIFFLPSSLPCLAWWIRAPCPLPFVVFENLLVEEQYCKLWWQFLYACTHYLIEVSMKILIATYGDISSYIKERTRWMHLIFLCLLCLGPIFRCSF
jgi:hypothetical protein